MRLIYFLSLAVVLASFSSSPEANAQKDLNDDYGKKFNSKQWSESEGYPAFIQAMVQTPDGYIWIGNEYGISRLDGTSITFFNRHTTKELIEDDCGALFVSNDSTLYCGMYNGLLVKYKLGRFETIGSQANFNFKTIRKIIEDGEGNIWIATDNAGLVKYRNGQFKSFGTREGIDSTGIRSLLRGEGGGIWVGTKQGLYLVSDKSVQKFGQAAGLTISSISALFYDHSGKLWIGGSDGIVFTYQSGKFTMVPGLKSLTGNPVIEIHEAPDRMIWILTDGLGINIFDPWNSRLYALATDPKLTQFLGTAILTDHEGDIIIGTQGASIFRLRKNLLKSYTINDGLPDNSVMGIFKDRAGDVWVSSVSGKIVRYRQGVFTDVTGLFGNKSVPVFSIGGGADNWIWAATYDDLIGTDGKNRRTLLPGKALPNEQFHAVYAARDGSIWAGTDAGILVLNNGNIRTITTHDGLSDDRIFCFYQDKQDKMWVGTQEGGINVIDKDKIKAITKKDGLSDNMILCFYQDSSDNMWIGTGHDGLNFIDIRSGKVSQLGPALNYPPSVTHIEEDKSGRLWIGTSFGITAVKRTNLEDYISGKAKQVHSTNFGPAEGMIAGGCLGGVFPAGCVTAGGNIWFTTTYGITEVNPSVIEVPSYTPLIQIQELLANNEVFSLSAICHIPAGVNDLEIKYSAPSFIMPEGINFRYKLEGYDQQWIDAKNRRSAFYNKVPPGDYLFLVQVMNHHGQWGEKTATLNIHIKPFFYQTTWFLIACILLVLALFYLFMKYRIRQVREKELEHLVLLRTEEIRKLNDELEQKVIDRTAQLGATNAELEAFSYSVSHDLKAPVRRIEGLIDALQEDYGEKLDAAAKDFLLKIAESISSMGLLIDELLKLSRIARQELERTDVNISSMSFQILEKLKAAYPDRKVTITVQPSLVLDCDARLIQIALQNLLDNAWKYSGKKDVAEISVFMELHEEKRVIVIRDNGEGFDMNHYGKLFTPFQRLHSDDQFTGTGIGLATVRRIIQKHGGTIWASSKPGFGTDFFFTVN